MPGFGQPLEDSSNHAHLLIAPSLIPQILIKTTEIMLGKPYLEGKIKIMDSPICFP
jgi:hypothetical protein